MSTVSSNVQPILKAPFTVEMATQLVRSISNARSPHARTKEPRCYVAIEPAEARLLIPDQEERLRLHLWNLSNSEIEELRYRLFGSPWYLLPRDGSHADTIDAAVGLYRIEHTVYEERHERYLLEEAKRLCRGLNNEELRQQLRNPTRFREVELPIVLNEWDRRTLLRPVAPDSTRGVRDLLRAAAR